MSRTAHAESASGKFMNWAEDFFARNPGANLVGTSRDLTRSAFGHDRYVNQISAHLSYLYNNRRVTRVPLSTGMGYLYTITKKTLHSTTHNSRRPTEKKSIGGKMGTGLFGAASAPSKTAEKVEIPTTDQVQFQVSWEEMHEPPAAVEKTEKKMPQIKSVKDIVERMNKIAAMAKFLAKKLEELNLEEPVDTMAFLRTVSDEELLAELRRRLEIERAADENG